MATVSEGSSTKKLKSDQDDLAEDLLVSTSEMDAELMKEVILEPSKSAGPGSQVSEDLDEDENSEDVDDDENSNSSCYDGMLSDYDDDEYDNETAKLQAQFDAADLPTGVEASISWLKQPTTQSLYDNETEKLQMQFDAAVLPAGVEPSISWMKLPAQSPNFDSQASSTASNSLSSHSGKEKEDNLDVSRDKLPGISISSQPGFSNEEKSADEVLEMFKLFKQFDVVQDYSDHHFTEGYCKSKQPSQNWTKIIQQEWKILEKDLPDTIFVRVFEERMDLLRAAIVGAAGTPYHDGLFFFDVFFPPDYPSIPPQVFYYSGGLRLNPNLYNCGKVCLSLLNTWPGQKDEKWIPGQSTVLQVLLSIQALVLNEKPYFNEPGYESSAGSQHGESHSRAYSEDTFILSCKTMMYTLRRPPKHYEYFVCGHFLERAHVFLGECKAYTEGAQVEFLEDKSGTFKLKTEVSHILPRLVQAFTKNGAKECEQFLPAPGNP